MQCNEKLRRKARGEGVSLWAIAHHLGVSEPTMTRWMRQPLPPEKEQRILDAIKELSEEVEA